LKEAKKSGINLVYYKNGFFDETEVDNIIRQLNSFDVQVIFVGMGVPKQELFAEKLSRSLKTKL
jgi:N-acetylglucosaminyldiphosphoundecaprenol N-acetyl-beta-D-mannosaminyltransferase